MLPRSLSCATALALFPHLATAQAGQLVGPVLNASAIVRAAPGFSAATNFAGACRDNHGRYWTTCMSQGQRVLVRFDESPLMTGFIPLAGGGMVADLAYDAQRDRLWVAQTNWPSPDSVQVIDALSGASLAITNSGQSLARGIAWNGADRIVAAGGAVAFDAQTMQSASPVSAGTGDRGILFLPDRQRFWVGLDGSNDPSLLGSSLFQESPGLGCTFPSEISIATGDGRRGGVAAGCEAWLSPSQEWLGVFCQTVQGGDAYVYTARLSRAIPSGCSGPEFSRGPTVMQSHLFARAQAASGFAFLLVSFGDTNLTHPIFNQGCTVLVDPATVVVLGAYLPSATGEVAGGTTVPVNPAFQELPLYFQWLTLGFNGFSLGEMRSAAVKQF